MDLSFTEFDFKRLEITVRSFSCESYVRRFDHFGSSGLKEEIAEHSLWKKPEI
jgi:hypothetical protein